MDMSIKKCDNCGLPIDTDDEMMLEVAGEEWCQNCYDAMDEGDEDEDE